MNKRRWLLHIFERAHEPTPQAEARLQRDIRRRVPDGRASHALLGALEPPSGLQERRLVARLQDIPSAHPRRRSLFASPTPARLALAGAAALALGLTLVLDREDEPLRVSASLDQQAAPSDLAPFPGVHLAYHGGYGELGGTTRSPEIRWISGKLDVEVEPDRGIQLSVRTEEALVQVIGTRFTVEREEAHTVVGVDRGKVSVTCSDGEKVFLTAGQEHSCASESPNKLALRAVRMQQRGAAPQQVLEVVDRGLAHAEPGDAAWSHLSTLRMRALRDAGQPGTARSEALSYLEAGHERRHAEVLRLALTLAEQPCSLALQHSVTLSAPEALPADLVALSDCLGTSDPEQARALLQRALEAPGLHIQDRAALQQRLDQLP
jgi:hypothetical protein